MPRFQKSWSKRVYTYFCRLAQALSRRQSLWLHWGSPGSATTVGMKVRHTLRASKGLTVLLRFRRDLLIMLAALRVAPACPARCTRSPTCCVCTLGLNLVFIAQPVVEEAVSRAHLDFLGKRPWALKHVQSEFESRTDCLPMMRTPDKHSRMSFSSHVLAASSLVTAPQSQRKRDSLRAH